MIPMIDTRAVGQELQEQVLAAARKGHRRVTTTMKNVTATAHMIRPQLPALPTIDLSTVKLPSADELAKRTERQLSQLRKAAPDLVARIPSAEHLTRLTEKQLDQLRKTAPGLMARLPNAEHLRTSASELAGQMRSVRHQVTDQVRTVTTPLAEGATSAFAQATATAAKTRKVVQAPAKPAATETAPAHASENGQAHQAAASTTAARKPRTAKTTAAPTRTAGTKPASTAAKTGKPAAGRSGTTKKAKPASK
jgi:hypothetical protein